MKKQKVRFIVNPKSGGTFGSRFTERMVKRNLDLSRFSYDMYYTRYAGHAIKLAQQSLIDKVDIIAVVGGDGTQNEVGQIIMDKNVLMANIPTGSGNANARTLGIPLHIPDAIQLINTGKPFPIDAVMINGQASFMASGIGYDGLVIDRFQKLPLRGVASYMASILSTALTYELPDYTIQIDDNPPFSRKAFTVLITSMGAVGFGIKFNHISKPNDGIFEISIVNDFNKMRIPQIIRESFFGDVASADFMETFQVQKKLKLTLNKVESLQMDGDFHGRTDSIEVTLKKHALRYIVPQDFNIT